ncbi:TetR/AcrR family transcriptional regulator [uncultured Roseobacter sp.]|uniref:TetR/AcrR family transcriptional regulator n=1 Tax=uncultured Roseobacter sp. TaxID=114847 RepID=UPI00262EB0A3|nr:TetR/AcrR family transcriptional regulator [uncultured Roseobacter sp.]
MPKIVDKAKMRNDILDAAMCAFAEKGYHATSVSDVAVAAGLAKGTLYIYFDSKEAMTTAIVDRHFATLEDQIACGVTCSTLDAFLEDLHRTMDIPAEQASFHRVFFEVFGPSFASEAFTAHVARFFEGLGAHYAKQIAHLQELGEIAGHYHAASIGRMLASMMDGAVLHRGLFDISQRRHRRMIQETLAMLRAGLRSSPNRA